MFATSLMAMVHAVIGHYISRQVFKGTWNKMKVVLKVFMAEDGVTPSSMVSQQLSFMQISMIFTLCCIVNL